MILFLEKPRPKKKPPVKLRDASELETDLPVMQAPNVSNQHALQENSESCCRAVSNLVSLEPNFSWGASSRIRYQGA